MLDCTRPDLGDMLYAWELDMLDEAGTDLVQEHLLECEHCNRKALAFESAARVFRHDPDVRPVVAELSQTEKPTETAPVRRFPLRRYMLAAALILAIGVPIYRLALSPGPPSEAIQRLNLVPVRGSRIEPIHLEHGGTVELRFYVKGATSASAYHVTITTDDGDTTFAEADFSAFDPPGSGFVALPVHTFDVGLHHLQVADSSGTRLAHYVFLVQ